MEENKMTKTRPIQTTKEDMQILPAEKKGTLQRTVWRRRVEVQFQRAHLWTRTRT